MESNQKYRETKSGIAICPFFIWKSENVEGLGRQEENDVSLVFCNHKSNADSCEGNCQENLCPLLMRKKCPDCSKNGGDGPRCPKHEVEYLKMENENNTKRIKELERKVQNA